jgi:nucleoside-diphosphate-sugar epimerase
MGSDPNAVSVIQIGGETHERRARRLFDEMARNIGREAVNHLKTMYPEIFSDYGKRSKSWETSLTNSIRNDINWRMRPLLMAMIAMHAEWESEAIGHGQADG